jgi:hypothetical protein
VRARTEPITEDTLAEYREQAAADPATGLPKLARGLREFGTRIDRDRPADGVPYLEEAAAIYRRLIADGAEDHTGAAMHAISSLGRRYSRVHADDLALAAKHEAAALARRINQHRADGKKEVKILADLAHGLAESGQFPQAVAAQREVVDMCRATDAGWFDNLAWSLLDLAIFLHLAGKADASLEIDHEVLALQRRQADEEPRRLPILAIWATGTSLWFASTGHRGQARELLREAAAACDRLPAEGSLHDFGFLAALHAAHFARSGIHDEQPGADPDRPLRPVFGSSFHQWSFSVRHAYRAGLVAINESITARSNPPHHDPARLAEPGTLLRRRNIREAVLSNVDHGPNHFMEQVIPALARSVDLERALLAADPAQGPLRLTRALTDQALALLAASLNASAANALQEAHDL